jgi:hypothetical protein
MNQRLNDGVSSFFYSWIHSFKSCIYTFTRGKEMKNYKHCPRCKHQHENLSVTYCEECGLNIDKYWNEQLHPEEKETKEEKPKKGTFDKNFFRGKQTKIRRR